MFVAFFRLSFVARVLSPAVRSLRQPAWRGVLAAGTLMGALGSGAASAEVQVVGSTATGETVQAQAREAEAQQLTALQQYIGDTYRVPLQSVQTLVESAWQVGEAMELDPLLLLAIMAIESSFNVKAESHMGAQGLMQVMTKIHRKRFEPHGGIQAAFNPEVNIEIGAQILQECIDRRGSVLGGLTCYVGAPGKTSQYGNKVLAKLDTLRELVTEAAEGVLVAAVDATEPQVATDEDHVIEAPPISRFVEADAPHLARNLLGERNAVDL